MPPAPSSPVLSKSMLNVIGTGKLGSVIGRLLSANHQVAIGTLFSRDIANARRAQQFIGQGCPTDDISAVTAANIWLISVADDAIESIANQLSMLDISWNKSVVFHCSGIQSSALLDKLAARGAEIASLHPAHSFADAERSLTGFSGTLCAIEGSKTAKNTLLPLFGNLGANVVSIDAAFKPLYHAATAVASNHLVALLDSSIKMLETAGLPTATALAIVQPLVLQTANNYFALGANAALTGPVSRGDSGTVAQHLKALKALTDRHPEFLASYLSLARIALTIAESDQSQSGQPKLGHEEIAALLAQYD